MKAPTKLPDTLSEETKASFKKVFRHLAREIMECFPASTPGEIAMRTNIELKLPKFMQMLLGGKGVTYSMAVANISTTEMTQWKKVVLHSFQRQGINSSPLEALIAAAKEANKEDSLSKIEQEAVKKGNAAAYLSLMKYKEDREKEVRDAVPISKAPVKKKGKQSNYTINVENLNLLNKGVPTEIYEARNDTENQVTKLPA